MAEGAGVTPDFRVVIPARYASTRLPGKPLLKIGGKPMVVRVADRAAASGARDIWVATDHPQVFAAAKDHGYNALMTSEGHATGTDRIAEVVSRLGWSEGEIVVNVQGDEPLIAPHLIREVALNLAGHADAAMATACHPIHEREGLFDPHLVKVVLDRMGCALYFSRAPIPFARDAFRDSGVLPKDLPAYRHIGIYAYRAAFLKTYGHLQPAAMETFEALEQLRVLWHGYKISVALTEGPPAMGVDTPEDLERVRRVLESG